MAENREGEKGLARIEDVGWNDGTVRIWVGDFVLGIDKLEAAKREVETINESASAYRLEGVKAALEMAAIECEKAYVDQVTLNRPLSLVAREIRSLSFRIEKGEVSLDGGGK